MKKNKIIKYPNAKKLSKEYQEANRRKNFNIDKKLKKGILRSYRAIDLTLILITILSAVFFSRTAYTRLFSAFGDLFNSIIYYSLLFAPDVEFEPIVNNIPQIDFNLIIPINWEAFKASLEGFWEVFFNGNTFIDYLLTLSVHGLNLSRILLVGIMCFFAGNTLIDSMIKSPNGKWFEKTKPLKFFEKRIYNKIYIPIKNYVLGYFAYAKGHYVFPIVGIIWLCNMNVMTIIIEAFAYFFYFARSFNLLNIYVQVYKLLIDILISLRSILLPILLITLFLWFDKWRTSFGKNMLRAREAHNLSFIKKLPIALMITATMGAGKTTLLTDMALTYSLYFRNTALKRMYKYFKYFPNFNWFKFRKYLDLAIKQRKIYNLTSTKYYIRYLQQDYLTRPCPEKLFGYDEKLYKVFHNNGLKHVFIWEALEIYAQLYFIYVMQTSLICSNYPIREDYVILNAGNLIMFNGDFFSKPITKETTHYSHILNYDTLRIGKTLVKNAEYRNSFEFGVIVMTEGGKERGNAIENICVKRNADECNVKNDLMELRVMMSRHPAVVDHFPFIVFSLDDQRDMTLGASFRELCMIIEISESSDVKIAMPLYYVELIIHGILNPLLEKVNNLYDHTHGNVGLFIRLFRSFCCLIINPIERRIEEYSYHVLNIRVGKATSEERKEMKYFIANYKIYREKFSTNTHNCYFEKHALKTTMGIIDTPTYSDVEMNDCELHAQASLWVEKMDTLGKAEEDPAIPEKKTKTKKAPEPKPEPESEEDEELEEKAFDISTLFSNISKE